MPSQVFFNEHYVYIKDGVLVVLLNVLLDSAKSLGRDEWSDRVRETWESRIQPTGCGCYELDLDQLVRTPEEKQRMLRLLENAQETLKIHGERVKKEWLNGLPYSEAIYLEDQDTSRFLVKLDALMDMLNG